MGLARTKKAIEFCRLYGLGMSFSKRLVSIWRSQCEDLERNVD